MAASEIERAALAYLARGWSVIVAEPRGKRPIVPWEPFQRRHPDEEELRAWLARHPDGNLAIVTGAVSGLVVLDVDPRHGGAASLSRWERDHGELPPTVEVQTGGGGRHLYFLHPGEELRNRVALAPGIDLRGDGGVVVAPPSVHPSGVRYRWLPGRAPDEHAVAPLPDWLLAIARGPADGPAGPAGGGWRQRAGETVPEGQRNQAIASFTGHLLWHGIDPAIARALMLSWNRTHCRPPLSDDEVVRTVASITRTHLRHQGEPDGGGGIRGMDRTAWDERYRSAELVWGAEPNRFLAQALGDREPAGRALDLACGEGRNAIWLAKRGWSVVGVDFSEVAIERARKLAAAAGAEVEWVLADVADYAPASEAFRLVVVSYLQVPEAERRAVLARAATALAPGGELFMIGHALRNRTEGVGGPKNPAVLWDPGELSAELRAVGLHVERCEEVRRPVQVGGEDREAIDVLAEARRPPTPAGRSR